MGDYAGLRAIMTERSAAVGRLVTIVKPASASILVSSLVRVGQHVTGDHGDAAGMSPRGEQRAGGRVHRGALEDRAGDGKPFGDGAEVGT